MSDKKLKDITAEFERIIKKAEKLKANKKYTDDERESIIKGIKEEFTEALLELEYIIDTPGYRDAAFEVQESFCLKARDLNIIKDDKELDEIFMEISKRKKAAGTERIKLLKKDFEKLILEKPPDINKLAYVLHDAIGFEEPGFVTEKYFVERLKELELFDDVDKLLEEIITRAGEKREREEVIIKNNHEARLRTLERERKKELKKEYAEVSKRAGSFHKTLDAIYKDIPLAPVLFESPGICEKCGKPIEEVLYYHDLATGVIMHSDCAKKVLDIKKKEKK